MLGPAAIVLAGAGGWLGQPWIVSLVSTRTPTPLTPRARVWTSRPVITAGSAAAGTAAFLPQPWPLLLTLVGAGVLGWWLTCVDVAIHRLPDPLVAALAGIFLCGYAGLHVMGAAQLPDLVRVLLTGGAAAGGFGVLALTRPRAMGFGDVKLAGALGIGVGWFGWTALGQWIILSFILGGVFALTLLISRRVGARDSIAFGPWLILGAALAIAMNSLAGVPH